MLTDFWLGFTSSTLGLSAAAWLAKNLIQTRLTNAVEFEFDQKLEKLKGELREKESRIASLQSTLLSSMSTRKATLDAAKLEACNILWKAAQETVQNVGLLKMLERFDLVKTSEKAKDDGAVRKAFGDLNTTFSVEKFLAINATEARPYVNESAWALYWAIRTMFGLAYSWLGIIEHGQDSNLLAIQGYRESLKAALPHCASEIDSGRNDLSAAMMDDLNERLLAELRTLLDGGSSDAEHLARSVDIMRKLNQARIEPAITDQKIRHPDLPGEVAEHNSNRI